MSRTAGRYRAHIQTGENDFNETRWFHLERGRGDFKLLTFPFDVVARNVGVGTVADSQVNPPEADVVLLCGLIVHSSNLADDDWSFAVVGHRGTFNNTIETKHTLNGVSVIGDIGDDGLSGTRCDLRIVGQADGVVRAYYQEVGTSPDSWTEAPIPGPQPDYGSQAYVGLITYASSTGGIPFVGTCDELQDYSTPTSL